MRLSLRPARSFWRLLFLLALCVPVLPASLFLGGGSARAAATTLYTITDLGTLGGAYSWAYGINNSGQVVGYAADAAGNPRAFLWQNGAMTDLGTLGGTQDTEAYAINNQGQVTGFSYGTGNSYRHAFLWQNGTMTDLGALPGATESFGWAINDSAQVAGQSGGQSFLWQNGTMSNPVPYGVNAQGINRYGHMVGYYYPPSPGPVGHAYLWVNGTVTDLGTLGGDFSEAYAGNDSDAVVGDARSPTSSNEAFLWQNGTMTGLGGLSSSNLFSYAYGINNANPVQVVGYSGTSGGNGAFVWQNGVMTDLNSVLMNGAGWQLADARAINDQGQIVGNGYINGQPHGYLLTPAVPAPIVYLHPAGAIFGETNPGSTSGPIAIVVANHGNADLSISSIAITGPNAADFSQTNTCTGPVSPGTACQVYVSFTPTGYGTRTASLAVTDNAGDSPQTEPLSGVGGTSAVTLSPASLSFGNQNTGPTSAQPVTLTNTGTADLTTYTISISGANVSDFAQTNTCGHPVAQGTSCSISVTFAPTATGARAASLNVWDGDINVTSSVPLSGTGTAPAASLSPAALSFGNQNTGTASPAQAVSLTNSGTGPLSLTGISMTGADQGDFTQTNTCDSSLAAGATCTINVAFTPVLTGSRTATLTVTDNAAGSPQTVSLSGTGTAPAVSLSPTSLSFGNQWYNTNSAAQTVTVTNTGSGALTFASTPFSIVGGNSSDFAQSATTCGNTLVAGAGCTVSVTFTPLGTGSRSSTLYVWDNASTSPQQVALSGFGLSADLGISLTPSASLVKSGTALTYNMAVTNAGPGTATGAKVTDPLPAGETFNSATSGCTVSSSKVTCAVGSLASGATATVSITVKVKTSSSSITDTATISASTYDPNTANNSAAATVTVR